MQPIIRGKILFENAIYTVVLGVTVCGIFQDEFVTHCTFPRINSVDYFLTIKPTRCTNFSILFME